MSVAAAVIVGTIAGCSAEAPRAAGGDVAAAESSAEPTPIMGDLNGDGVLTPFEAEWLAKSKEAAAVRDFGMADGTVVEVDPTQPLPEVVRADIIGRFADDVAVTTSTTEGDVRDPRSESMLAKANELAAATGRDLMFVHPALSRVNAMDPLDTTSQIVWLSFNSAPEGGNPFLGPDYKTDRDAYIAAATEAAGTKYELLILD